MPELTFPIERPPQSPSEVATALPEDLADAELSRLFPSRSVRRVLFVHPPDTPENLFDFDTCKRRSYPHYPPYGLMTLASQARKINVEVELLDLNAVLFAACAQAESEESFDYSGLVNDAIDSALSRVRPDLVGLGCMFSYSHHAFAAACDRVRQVAPSIPIIVGGVHVTNSVASPVTAGVFFRDLKAADIISLYESDVSFRDLLQVINRELPSSALSQVIVNDRSGRPIRIQGRGAPSAEDMGLIPAFDLVDIGSYSSRGSIGNFSYLKPGFQRAATTLSNRGCRAQCTFCSVRNFNGVGVRRREIQRVIDELKCLRNDYGVDHVMWLDDDFLYNHKASIELFEEMVRQNVGVTWDCSNGVLAASCKEEVLSAAVASGCIGLHIGIESGNNDILRKVRKPATVKVYLEAAETLRKFPQIYARVFLMVGFDGETFRQILDTVNLCNVTGFDWHSINVVEPLPNTAMWNQMKKEESVEQVDFEKIQYITNPVNFKASGGKSKVGSHFALDFREAFKDKDLDTIPTRTDLVTIRSFMDFTLNFMPIFREERWDKLILKKRHLEHILDVVAPNNAIAMYFLGYVQRKLDGQANPGLLRRLDETVARFPVWQQQFTSLDLAMTHIRNYSP